LKTNEEEKTKKRQGNTETLTKRDTTQAKPDREIETRYVIKPANNKVEAALFYFIFNNIIYFFLFIFIYLYMKIFFGE